LHDADVALPLVGSLLEQDVGNLGLQRYHDFLVSERDRLWSGSREIWALVGGHDFRARLATVIASI
jgi:hypothetical protein